MSKKIIHGILLGLVVMLTQKYLVVYSSNVLTDVFIVFGPWILFSMYSVFSDVLKKVTSKKIIWNTILVWSIALVIYYVLPFVMDLFVLSSGDNRYHIENFGEPFYLLTIMNRLVFGVILSIIEWIPLAFVGGAIVSVIFRRLFTFFLDDNY